MPSGDRADKATFCAKEHRVSMLQIMLAHEFGGVSQVSINRCQVDEALNDTTTITLLDYFTSLHPEDHFAFVIGEDLVEQLPTWWCAERLMREYKFLVVPRLGSSAPAKLPSCAEYLVPAPLWGSSNSSTMARTCLSEGACLAGILPRPVISYIESRGLYGKNPLPSDKDERLLFSGQHARFMIKQGWEYVERVNNPLIVAIAAVTEEGNLLLIEQYRPSIGRYIIEIPAGLVGDEEGVADETCEDGARRELLEETGYEAAQLEFLFCGPPSSGLSAEIIHFYRASNLKRLTRQIGVGHERITLHEVPLAEIDCWIAKQLDRDVLVDPKVYTILYFLQHPDMR